MKDPLNLKLRQIVVQFPFSAPATEEKTEEELARIAERRREQGRKLQEIAAKARMEKVRARSMLLFRRVTYRHPYSWYRRRLTCSI